MATEIDALLKKINTKAKHDVMIRGADLAQQTWQRASTGSLVFDLVLGGGWPLDCWNEVVGVESSGKTAMLMKAIAHNQAVDPDFHTVWAASEDFDIPWAQTLGVDTDRITFVMSNAMEQVFDVCLAVQEEQAADALIIDSYPALVPDDEDDKSMMEFTVGRGALLTNKFFRKSYAAQRRDLGADRRPMLCVMVNQWRDRIGTVGYGDPRITPGGKGKNYSFMTRLDVAREEWIKAGTEKVGQRIKIEAVKNKTAPPRRKGSVEFYFADHKGFQPGDYDTLPQIWSTALAIDVIEQSGAWYSFGDQKWNGKDKILVQMHDDPLLTAALNAHVRHVLLHEGPTPPPYAAEVAPVAKARRRVVKK